MALYGQRTLPSTFGDGYFGLSGLPLNFQRRRRLRREPTVPRPASWNPQVKISMNDEMENSVYLQYISLSKIVTISYKSQYPITVKMTM